MKEEADFLRLDATLQMLRAFSRKILGEFPLKSAEKSKLGFFLLSLITLWDFSLNCLDGHLGKTNMNPISDPLGDKINNEKQFFHSLRL